MVGDVHRVEKGRPDGAPGRGGVLLCEWSAGAQKAFPQGGGSSPPVLKSASLPAGRFAGLRAIVAICRDCRDFDFFKFAAQIQSLARFQSSVQRSDTYLRTHFPLVNRVEGGAYF